MRVDSSFIPLPIRRPVAAPVSDGTRIGGGEGGFAEVLREALARVNETQQAADIAARRVATGEADDLHEAIIALEKADLTLRLTAQVTQRAVEAYREVSRMQL
jgi:flagellar hook-basal body complex protein FliE